MAAPLERPPRGLHLATVGSIPVYIGWSWLLLGALIIVIVGPGTAARFGAVTGYGIAAVYALSLLLSVLAHETAHAVVARAFGHRVHRVVADLWGGHTAYDASHGTPWSAAGIAVVGPLSNALIGVLAFGGALVLEQPVLITLLSGIAFVNGALAAFNLLPGLPLDGGQVVEAVIWAVTGNQSRARIIAGWAGRVLVLALVLVIVGGPLLRGISPDLTPVLWTALVAAFLLFNILIGIVINSMEEAREIEHVRLRTAEREAAIKRGEDPDAVAPDADEEVVQRIADLRDALDELETRLKAEKVGV